jgi:hypothetical protein
LVFFSGKSKVGKSVMIIAPLNLLGEWKIGGETVTEDKYYIVLRECVLENDDDGKLAALVMSNISDM